jgi:hypothetical protein
MSNVFTIRSILTGEESKVLDFHRDAMETGIENQTPAVAQDSYEGPRGDTVPLKFSSLISGHKTDPAG